jgi:putative heme transporter
MADFPPRPLGRPAVPAASHTGHGPDGVCNAGGTTIAVDPMPPDDEAPTARPRSQLRRVVQSVLSIGLVIAIFVFVLPQIADFGKVWAEIRAMTWQESGGLGAAAFWNLATYWLLWVAVLPGLTISQAAVSTEASTAVANTVPGGSYLAVALNYSMIHSWGFRRSVVTLSLLISGVWNNFAKLALPVLALAALAVTGEASASRLVAAALGVLALVASITIFAMALRTEEAAGRIGRAAERVAGAPLRLIRRPPPAGWDVAVTRFREKTIVLLRNRWLAISLATVVGHLSLFLVLLVALRNLGVSQSEVGWAEVLAVFSFTRLVTAIPLTPGGLGVVELALTSGLVAAGGNREEVVAAVLVYRFLTYVLPIPLGVLSYVFWRRNTSWRREALPVLAPAAAAG